MFKNTYPRQMVFVVSISILLASCGSAVPVSTPQKSNPSIPQKVVKGNEVIGEEVIQLGDQLYCVRASQQREAFQLGLGLEDPRHPDQICKENALRICQARGFGKLVALEKEPAASDLGEIGEIQTDENSYEYVSLLVSPEDDFIPAQDDHPEFVTFMLKSVKCSERLDSLLTERTSPEDPDQLDPNGIDQGADQVGASTDRFASLRSGFNTVRERARSGFNTARERARFGFDTARERARSGFNTARERARSGLHVARERVSGWWNSATQRVQDFFEDYGPPAPILEE